MLKKARMQRRIENRNSGINYLLLPITHELSELICNSILDETFLSDSPILELHLQMWIINAFAGENPKGNKEIWESRERCRLLSL